MSRAWGTWIGLVLAACGGVTDGQQSSTADEVTPRSADGGEPSEVVEATGGQPAERDGPAAGGEPAAGEKPVEAVGGSSVEEVPAGGTSGENAGGATGSQREHGCEDVCATLEECAGEPLAECSERCSQSLWVGPPHDINCLALRIYWINEEGCETMLQTYASFAAGDDCED